VLPAPSKSKFTPSKFFACSAGMSAAASVAGALGDEVRAFKESWLKSLTVSTTRAPAACALVMRVERAWLS